MTRLRSILSESLLVLCMPFYALYLLLVPARVQRTPARRQQLRTRWMIAGAALVFVALPLLVTNGSLATQPTQDHSDSRKRPTQRSTGTIASSLRRLPGRGTTGTAPRFRSVLSLLQRAC
jgi:hypothetical protein